MNSPCYFTEYLSFWSNKKIDQKELFKVFPFLIFFLTTKRSSITKKEYYLVLPKKTQPCDLFLNYMLINNIKPTNKQLNKYRDLFGLAESYYTSPSISMQALAKVGSKKVISKILGLHFTQKINGVNIFDYTTYYNISSDRYELSKTINYNFWINHKALKKVITLF